MKAKNIPFYLAVGMTAVLIFAAVAWTNTRESYDIAECSEKYQFLNYTISREVKWGTAAVVNLNLVIRSTLLYVYPTHELQERGLLDTLYSEATNDPEVFLVYEEKNTYDAVVLLKTVPSDNEGEEPIFCVVGKKEVKVIDLLNDDTFSIGVQWKRTERDLPPTEHARRVISWGP